MTSISKRTSGFRTSCSSACFGHRYRKKGLLRLLLAGRSGSICFRVAGRPWVQGGRISAARYLERVRYRSQLRSGYRSSSEAIRAWIPSSVGSSRGVRAGLSQTLRAALFAFAAPVLVVGVIPVSSALLNTVAASVAAAALFRVRRPIRFRTVPHRAKS